MVENVTKSLEDKKYTLGVFLDLSKVFDIFDHSILLAKLNHFGVRRVANKRFRSYLNGRLMQTKIDGKNFKIQANCGRGATGINSCPPSIFNLHK